MPTAQSARKKNHQCKLAISTRNSNAIRRFKLNACKHGPPGSSISCHQIYPAALSQHPNLGISGSPETSTTVSLQAQRHLGYINVFHVSSLKAPLTTNVWVSYGLSGSPPKAPGPETDMSCPSSCSRGAPSPGGRIVPKGSNISAGACPTICGGGCVWVRDQRQCS